MIRYNADIVAFWQHRVDPAVLPMCDCCRNLVITPSIYVFLYTVFLLKQPTLHKLLKWLPLRPVRNQKVVYLAPLLSLWSTDTITNIKGDNDTSTPVII